MLSKYVISFSLPSPWLLLCQHKNSKSKQICLFGLNASFSSCLPALHLGHPLQVTGFQDAPETCILLPLPEMLFLGGPSNFHHLQVFAQMCLPQWSLFWEPYLKLHSLLPTHSLSLTAWFFSIVCIIVQHCMDCLIDSLPLPCHDYKCHKKGNFGLFCFLLHPQCLYQSLIYNRPSINIC